MTSTILLDARASVEPSEFDLEIRSVVGADVPLGCSDSGMDCTIGCVNTSNPVFVRDEALGPVCCA